MKYKDLLSSKHPGKCLYLFDDIGIKGRKKKTLLTLQMFERKDF